jgi:anti-sigma B factor antagonist
MLRRISSSLESPVRPQPEPALLPGQLTVTTRTSADEVTLLLYGEIDFASAPALEQALREAEKSRPRRVVLDLAALDFIDSTGIHLLIDAQQRADANGHQLILTHVPVHVQRLFALTGLDARLSFE